MIFCSTFRLQQNHLSVTILFPRIWCSDSGQFPVLLQTFASGQRHPLLQYTIASLPLVTRNPQRVTRFLSLPIQPRHCQAHRGPGLQVHHQGVGSHNRDANENIFSWKCLSPSWSQSRAPCMLWFPVRCEKPETKIISFWETNNQKYLNNAQERVCEKVSRIPNFDQPNHHSILTVI